MEQANLTPLRPWCKTAIHLQGASGRDISEAMIDNARRTSEVFAAVHAAGLNVDHLGEPGEDFWPSFPNLPAAVRGTLPRTYSLRATKPA